MHCFSCIVWLSISICRHRSSFPSKLDLDHWWKSVSFLAKTLSVRSLATTIHFFLNFKRCLWGIFNPKTLLKFISFLPSLAILSSFFFTLLFLLWQLVSATSLVTWTGDSASELASSLRYHSSILVFCPNQRLVPWYLFSLCNYFLIYLAQ